MAGQALLKRLRTPVLLVMGLIAAGALAVWSSGWLSVKEVRSGILTARQIPGEQYNWMLRNDLLGAAERVFYYSDDSGKPYTESGNLLTNQFVGAWWKEDGELETGWIRIGEICRIEKTRTASDVEENMYTIHTFGDDSWLRILLPKSGGIDGEFVARMNYLNDEKMHSEVRSACDESREPDWEKIAARNGIQKRIVGPDAISQRQLSWLRHNDFLSREEEILSFYSNGHYSIATGGLLLTDTHFGGWTEDTDGLHSWWFEFGEICELKLKSEATKTKGPLFRVDSQDNWFQFHLPDDDAESLELIAQVEAMNSAAQTNEMGTACAAFLEEQSSEDEA